MGLEEGGADQSKYDETKYGDGGDGQGSERAEWPRLRAGAGRTLGSQITPKTFLRRVNYGGSFVSELEKNGNGIFPSNFTLFSA